MTIPNPTKKPIYPPNRVRAIVYWALSFASFFAAAYWGEFVLVVLTGITLAAVSSYLGEQLYKTNVYKEILYYRALETMISVEQEGNGDG